MTRRRRHLIGYQLLVSGGHFPNVHLPLNRSRRHGHYLWRAVPRTGNKAENMEGHRDRGRSEGIFCWGVEANLPTDINGAARTFRVGVGGGGGGGKHTHFLG